MKKPKMLSKRAKDITNEDYVITVGYESLPIISISKAFGRITITYGNDNTPKQNVYGANDYVVIDEIKHKATQQEAK